MREDFKNPICCVCMCLSVCVAHGEGVGVYIQYTTCANGQCVYT